MTNNLDEVDKLLSALEAISKLNPDDDSEEGWNEWGEADCYKKAVEIAITALAGWNSANP